MKWISGCKTYIAGAGLILTGIALCIDGQYDEGVQSILAGFGLIGVKAAVVKAGTK